VIDFKSQYMRQIMEIRENFAKEREILQAYEQMKQQQNQEIARLTAVSQHLQHMATTASHSYRQHSSAYGKIESNLNETL
jgi:biopolymer transport protein ExbB/TolQ